VGFLEDFEFVVVDDDLLNYVGFGLGLGGYLRGFVVLVNLLMRNLGKLRLIRLDRLIQFWGHI
jgi:hypothetical protein